MSFDEMLADMTDGTIPTSHGDMTPRNIVDELTYANYRWNRQTSDLPVEVYARYFGADKVAEMEARFQTEN
jgi:hypothetical protein